MQPPGNDSLLPSYHLVAPISTQSRLSGLPKGRLERILDEKQLRPPADMIRAALLAGREDDSAALQFYLSGLRGYVFFSYGRVYGSTTGSPVAVFEADTKVLIRDFAGRVAHQGCLFADEILEHLHPSDDVDCFGWAQATWESDPAQWERTMWPKCYEIASDMTLGGDEAMDFLSTFEPKDEVSVDILVPGAVPIDILTRVEA